MVGVDDGDAGAAGSGWHWHDRAFIAGMTGSGKSTLAAARVSAFRCRRVLVDPKQGWRVPGVAPTRLSHTGELGAVDWTQPVIHIQPTYRDWQVLEALYAHLNTLRGVCVWTDEALGVSSAHRAPAGLLALQTTGRGRRGSVVCSQRPVNVEATCRTEAEHVVIFGPLERRDLEASLEGVPFLTVAAAEQTLRQLPRHGFIHCDRRAQRATAYPPLPGQLHSRVFRNLT